ncbi:MAG TPA: threonine--tRNA ligase [Candidatus Dormibacteraeota bacterium]|nr:threonine--tRNA ligase [Candidatus Dormibacteraeota bacterium]
MGNIRVTLLDGKSAEVPQGATPAEVARQLAPEMEREALLARSEGELIDLNRPLERDTTLQLLTASDPEVLPVFRHSAAHLMAAAVLELFPGVKFGVGPPIDYGFFYEFQREEPFTAADLERIEAKMREISERDLPNLRRMVPKQEAMRLYREAGQPFKCELVEEKASDPLVSLYSTGQFVDFCRGPHVPSTGRIRAFKVMSVSGAYWKGQEGNPQMQRIYAACFPTEEGLEAFLHQLEEAKRRDHRRLGTELGLFSIEEEAGPGLIFWHPKGALVRKVMEDWLRDELLARGYDLVFTPHVMRLGLWETSGHANFYRENMFATMEVEDAAYQLKPMNCPGHILIYKSRLRSYRELPLRLAELGTVYRYERSGVLHGLLRVRGFTQDDAHIFCTHDQIESEVEACIDFALATLKTFGFEKFRIELSVRDPARPEDYAGTVEDWERAEGALVSTLERLGMPFTRMEGEAVFYGPKIDVKLIDAIGRPWQLSTVQFDFNLPRRFGMEYVGEDGGRHQPLMVHRALWGSVERFFGILIEHYAGAFPLWLAPEQARVIPVSAKAMEYARQVRDRVRGAGIRGSLDERDERLQAKIRDAQMEKVPYMLIVGPKEAQSGSVAVRHRSRGDLGPRPLEDLLADLRQETATRGTDGNEAV